MENVNHTINLPLENQKMITNTDRIKLKQDRAVRNKLKKEAKRLKKQEDLKARQSLLKIQPLGNNITLITGELAEKISGKPFTQFKNSSINAAEFPVLGSTSKVVQNNTNNNAGNEINVESKIIKKKNEAVSVKKSVLKMELSNFIPIKTVEIHKQKETSQSYKSYSGNPLDSDLPIRKRGKFREIPKIKKPSKLKRDILVEREEKNGSLEGNNDLMKNVYCDNIITEELTTSVKSFVSAIVTLQEKLYKRDAIKGRAKRRYVVGLHEVKKHIKLNKVKILIVATDIQMFKQDGVLNGTIKDITDLAQNNKIPYLFALKRRQLGAITLKYIPVSCIAVLNYEGLEEQFNNLMVISKIVKEDYKEINSSSSMEDCEDVSEELISKFMAALK